MGRAAAQMCGTTYPDTSFLGYRTAATGSSAIGLLDDTPPPPVVVIGSSYSQPKYNFGGFLSDSLDLDVITLSIPAGRALGSMLAFFQSETWQENPPRVLVWEVPFHTLHINDRGQTPTLGDPSLPRQLVPAIHGACSETEAVAQVTVDLKPGPISLDLVDGLDPARHYLYITTTQRDPGPMSILTHWSDGTGERFDIPRYARIEPVGRQFFAWPGGPPGSVDHLQVLATADSTGQLEARVCAFHSQAPDEG